jgi:hypothetical protein
MPPTMQVPRRPTLAISLAAIGLAVILAVLVWRPVSAPTATATPTPGPSASVPSVPTSDESTAPVDGVAGRVTWDEPLLQPFGERDVLLRIDGMVGTDDLLLGWGRTPMPGRNQFNDMGAIFASADGVTWRTVPVEHGVNAVSASTINDVAIGPLGLLAVGSVCCEPEQGAVWRSADGLAWERLEVDVAFDAGGQPASVVATEEGWSMLVGLHVGSALFHSADGVAWEPAIEVEANRMSRGIEAVGDGPGGLLAVGTAQGPDETYDGVIWRSTDGRTWDRVAVDDAEMVGEGEVYLHDVAGFAGGYLATGMLGTAEQRRACEELGLVASIMELPPPPREMATSCALGDEAQWVSADGLTWEHVEFAPDELRPIEFRLVRAGGPGLVALGEGSGPESPDTMLFGSRDGIRWEVLSDAEAMLGDVAQALVVRGHELIAVTENWDGAQTTYRVWRGRAG